MFDDLLQCTESREASFNRLRCGRSLLSMICARHYDRIDDFR